LAGADGRDCQDFGRVTGSVVTARSARFIDGMRRLFRRTRLEQEFDAELSGFLETSKKRSVLG
jgi:hypothetical protein